MLISFSGVDGCGKTTLARKAVEMLRHRRVKASYVRVADLAIARRAGDALGSVSRQRAMAAVSSTDRGIALLRKTALVFDALLFRLTVLWAKLSNSALVCDRYFFDSIVHLNYLGISTKRFERMLLAIAPKPTVVFFIAVKPAVAAKRNREFPKGFYEKKHLLYARIFKGVKHIGLENADLNKAVLQVEKAIAGVCK